MNKLPRITEIIKIEPFKVTVRWTTGEIRVIDFEPLLREWGVQAGSNEAALGDYETFKYVSVAEERTLQWVNVLVEHLAFFDGDLPITRSSPLSFDPDVLYEASRPIEDFKLVPLNEVRQAA